MIINLELTNGSYYVDPILLFIANPEESDKIPDRYKKKLIMSDEEIDEEFNFSLEDDDDDDDINPYETVDHYQ